MKSLVIFKIILLSIVFSSKLYCQSTTIVVKDYEELKKKYFKYPGDKIELIRSNWDMYFNENVLTVLDTNKIIKHLFELKLDSYGCVYPSAEILSSISHDEFNGPVEDYKLLESHSFERIFIENKSTQEKLKTAISKLNLSEKEKNLYNELFKISPQRNKNIIFAEKWNGYYLEKAISNINQKIKTGNIERVVFFIHGYNVPYSLAALQSICMFELMKSEIDSDKTLFVPVYWPSNNAKLDSLRQENFTTENIKEFKRNGALFLTYSNRCYFSAFTLRKILNSLPDSIKINIVSHSLGATIATSCLINSASKLHYNRFSKLKRNSHNPDWINKHSNTTFKGKNEINYILLKNFYSIPVPEKKISVFLSAGAIPGVSTFCDVNALSMKNKRFYVTINPNDEMVTKNSIKQAAKKATSIEFSYIKANRLSSTTLGCNWKGEALKARDTFNSIVTNSDNFFLEQASEEIDHDIFTYMQQQKYIDFFYRFLKDIK